MNTPKVTNLKHFGHCWYSLAIPLSVQREQFKALMTSRLAGKFSLIRKIGLVAGILKRMGQNRAKGRQYAKSRGIELKKLVNEFSMMSAGFAVVQDWLGVAEGYPLFKEMFLATGRKEMAWFWPDSSDFFSFDDPFDAFKRYWIAYLDASTRLSLLHYEIPIDKLDSFEVNITDCVYHELFTLFRCPELTKLIFETEYRALKRLAAPIGFNLSQKINIASGGFMCGYVWQHL